MEITIQIDSSGAVRTTVKLPLPEKRPPAKETSVRAAREMRGGIHAVTRRIA